MSNAGRAGSPVGGAGTSAAAAGRGGSAGNAGSRAGAGGATAGSTGASGAAAGSGGSGSGTFASGPSKCPNPALYLCDGFEGAEIDRTLWGDMNTPPTLDAMRAARGSKALHVSTTATGYSGLKTKKSFPVETGHYYGRMFVYFDVLPTSPQWAHWTVVGANPYSNSGEKGEIRVGGQYDGKINRWGVGTDLGPTGDWTNLDADPKNAVQAVAEKKWVCIEWLHDWANDETRFYLDGVEHPSLNTTRDVKHLGNADVKYEIPELGSVWVGFWNYNQNKPVTPDHFDTWIDEVAFDDERIGCEN